MKYVLDLPAIRKQLEREEGDKRFIYQDTRGNLTGGIGHNFSAKPLSDAVVSLLFMEDLTESVRALDIYCPHWRDLDDVRARVYVDMMFNMGAEAFVGFRRFHAAVLSQNWNAAVTEMEQSRWHVQVGERAVRLEAMMRTGTDGSTDLKA